MSGSRERQATAPSWRSSDAVTQIRMYRFLAALQGVRLAGLQEARARGFASPLRVRRSCASTSQRAGGREVQAGCRHNGLASCAPHRDEPGSSRRRSGRLLFETGRGEALLYRMCYVTDKHACVIHPLLGSHTVRRWVRVRVNTHCRHGLPEALSPLGVWALGRRGQRRASRTRSLLLTSRR